MRTSAHSRRRPSPWLDGIGIGPGHPGGLSDPNLGLGQLVAAASIASESPDSSYNDLHSSSQHSHTANTGTDGGNGPVNRAGESSSSVVAALKARQPKTGAKRGRKRIDQHDDHNDQTHGRTSAKRDIDSTLDPNEKRKLQNRAAQRAFRERKDQHVKDMEVATVSQAAQLEHYYNIIQRLLFEVEALRRGKHVQPDVTELPSPPITAPTMDHDHSTTPPPSQLIREHSPLDVKPVLPLPSKLPAVAAQRGPVPPAVGAFTQLGSIPTFNLAPSAPLNQSSILDRAPYSTMAEMAATLPAPGPLPLVSNQQVVSDVEMTPFSTKYDSYDDFVAPFDLTSAVPLPPLFNDLFSQTFAPLPLSTAATRTAFEPNPALEPHPIKPEEEEDELDEDFCPIDDGEPVLLPNGRLPCDKPECDFTSYSCALPMPWRPPSLEDDIRSRDVWVAQVAWAKLVTHPQFKYCSVDELCSELRDRARCSEDGRVVISKMEACDVFRSIPRRARAAREREEL